MSRLTRTASEPQFVAVDCETTGLHPGAHHRVIELAMPLDSEGRPGRPWCSLICPDRDLGDAEIHGIHAYELGQAPSFEDIAGTVLEHLAGRAIVAHNARFDCGFLEHELRRIGYELGPLPRLCTMELANRAGLGGSGLRLSDCCAEIGASHSALHTAEGDALACATLFASCLRRTTEIDRRIQGQLRTPEEWPAAQRRSAPLRRATAGERRFEEPAFLQRLVRESEIPISGDPARHAPYIDLLDRAIEDRLLDDTEQGELEQLAASLGLSAEDVKRLHRDYLGALAAAALRDHVLTERERYDLEMIADALGVMELDALLTKNESSASMSTAAVDPDLHGKTVCFTGKLLCRYEGEPVTRTTAERLAEEAGLTILPRVTKSLDLLVIADPDSMSGKAKKAREYGTRIIAEASFWPLIGVEVA